MSWLCSDHAELMADLMVIICGFLQVIFLSLVVKF